MRLAPPARSARPYDVARHRRRRISAAEALTTGALAKIGPPPSIR